MRLVSIVLASFALLLAACENTVKKAAREMAYSGYEMLGIDKRDLLKRRIASTKTEQRAAGAKVGDALEKFRAMYRVPDTELARRYRDLRGAYDDSDQRARAAREARGRMRTTAEDLFGEWDREIARIHEARLRGASQRQLAEARAKFRDLDHQLGRAETKMNAVLVRLGDHVLAMKHDLNAESLNALGSERDAIERDMARLVDDMNAALTKADRIAL